ncbi:hypothetical protein NIES37_44980 [Tolypothrix tenuis PCC 7101]|uniref:Uncharacterized protein n=1 Tax=Tolypothrix tenuis PCC 7101 TaxID=231146 RepID=A0A1Z4N472_9CYAN|nr:hypothetical protein NIES37_44980 [Tolypothrix tenuis PCC 7101]BAZ75572.1 hypothetical protein NIES50_41600 [Aulosira laxa NIES-50]
MGRFFMEGEEKYKYSPNTPSNQSSIMYFSALTHKKKKFQDEVVKFKKEITERLNSLEKTIQSLQLICIVLLFFVVALLVKTIGNLLW